MKSSTVLLVVVLISILCCGLAACALGITFLIIGKQDGYFDISPFPQTGQVAPDFQLATIEGQKISLNEFRGKPVMVNFWALWCRPCIKEMPIIEERYQQHYPDLVVLAIEEDGEGVGVRDYITESNFSFLVLAGNDNVARRYNIHAYPTSIFIDEHGIIQSLVVGSLSSTALDEELAKIGVGD